MPTTPTRASAARSRVAKPARIAHRKVEVGPSAAERAGVLGGVKGSRAELAGSAALDSPCALQPDKAAGDGRTEASGGGSRLRSGASKKEPLGAASNMADLSP